MSRHRNARTHRYLGDNTVYPDVVAARYRDFSAIRVGCIATGTPSVKININSINGLSNDFLNVRAKFCPR